MKTKTTKLIRFVAAGDNHGDMADPEATNALFEYCKEYRPHIRVHLGDCFDFRSLRKGVHNDAESAESLQSDIDAGIEFLRQYKPNVYLLGNHEARLDALIRGSGSAIVRDYCSDLKSKITREARKAGASVIKPYHADKGIHRIGPVAFIHGYEHGNNATESQGVFYAEPGGALLHGHTHNFAQINLKKHGGGVAFSCGNLCQKYEMHYAQHRLATAKWGQGFAAGWIDGEDWKVWFVHKIGRRWIWQSNLTVWSPKK